MARVPKGVNRVLTVAGKLLPAFCLCVALLPARARALGNASADFAAYRTASVLLPYSFPIKPMVKGRLEVKGSPAYVRFDRQVEGSGITDNSGLPGGKIDQTISGAALVAAVNYTAIENDWGRFGFGALGLGFKEDGTRLGIAAGTAQAPVGIYGSERDRGVLLAVTLNYDAFKGDGFRMPMIVGLTYTALEQTSVTEGPLTAAQASGFGAGTYRFTQDVNLRSPGVMIGFSPQFNTGQVRWSPFAMMSVPFTKTVRHDLMTKVGSSLPSSYTNNNGQSPTVDPVGGLGLSIIYRPWGIGPMFTIPWITQGASAYSLTFSKSFGGGSSAGEDK
jgi:hypothetical protein